MANDVMKEMDAVSKDLSKQLNRPVKILKTETPIEYVTLCIKVAGKGLNEKKPLSQIAAMITGEMKRKMGNFHWFCVFGKRYGSNITHEKGYYIYFEIEQFAVMVFRHTETCERTG